MRKLIAALALLGALLYLLGWPTGCSFAQEQPATQEQPAKATFLLLIAEQNIEGPQRAWWMSEIDLSTIESALARRLIESGYEVLEPSVISKEVTINKAFKRADLPDTDSIKLGKNLKADYVILGKAVASAGGTVPQSTMRSCFANVTVKLIRVKDGKVIAYLDAAGSTVHMDVITGDREALANAGQDLANKIINAMTKEGGN